MTTYYVETYRPAYPDKGVKIQVHAEKQFCRDSLSPCMTSVFKVQHVKNRAEAVACIIEHAAGKGTAVSRVF